MPPPAVPALQPPAGNGVHPPVDGVALLGDGVPSPVDDNQHPDDGVAPSGDGVQSVPKNGNVVPIPADQVRFVPS